MSSSTSNARYGWTALVAVLICLGMGWALYARNNSSGLQAEAVVAVGPDRLDLSVDALKKADPLKVMELFRSDTLTEEEKETLRENAREARMERMNEIITSYFAAQPEDRTAILDEQIDEWVAMRKRMEEWREENPDDEQTRERWREHWRNRPAPSREERKEAFETGRSEQRSRMMTYFTAARARMQERGVEMPRWGSGHRGSGGGRPDRGERPRNNG